MGKNYAPKPETVSSRSPLEPVIGLQSIGEGDKLSGDYYVCEPMGFAFSFVAFGEKRRGWRRPAQAWSSSLDPAYSGGIFTVTVQRRETVSGGG